MCDFDEDNEMKPLTREALEDLSNRCARLNLYKGTPDYDRLIEELCWEGERYQRMDDFIHTVQENGKEGVRNDFFNHWIVPPMFDKIISEARPLYIGWPAYIVMDNGKYGIVQSYSKGTLICPCIYDKIELIENFLSFGWLKLTMNGKYGIIGLYEGGFSKVEVEPIYDDIQEIEYSHHILLKKDGKYGLLSAKYILPTEYERIFVPSIMGWIKVMKDGEWGYIDINNEFTEDMNKAFLYSCFYE